MMPDQNNNRRAFLKKTMYVAPTVLALGALTTPAHASGSAGFVTGPVTTTTGDTPSTKDLSFPAGSPMGDFFGGQ